jgi:N-acetylneuraminic acid mutarotase
MDMRTYFVPGLALAALCAGLISCQKQADLTAGSASPAAGGAKATSLTVGLQPVITWWEGGGDIPYNFTPSNPPLSETGSIGFSINNKGYIMDGQFPMTNGNYIWLQALWMFDPATQSWSKQSMASDLYLTGTESLFVIGDNAYVVTGNQLWQYNQPSNQWTQKHDFPGVPRLAGSAFAINGKGYFGLGDETNSEVKDWWQYDPASDSWTQLHDFAGEPRDWACTFSLNGKGYVLFGNNYKTVWLYDPATDTWTKKQNCPAPGMMAPATATIGGVVVGLMTDGNDVWEYNPTTDGWSDQGAIYGGPRNGPAGFVIGDSYFLCNLSVDVYNWSR